MQASLERGGEEDARQLQQQEEERQEKARAEADAQRKPEQAEVLEREQRGTRSAETKSADEPIQAKKLTSSRSSSQDVSPTTIMMSALTLLVGGCAVLAAMGFKGRVTTVGIDLGTTFSVIAYSHRGKVTVISDKEYNVHIRRKLGLPSETSSGSWFNKEHSIFPSMVSFLDGGETVVGYAAQARLSDDPRNTIFNAKRFIGRSLEEEDVQLYAESHPYKAVAVGNDTTAFGAVGFNLSVSGHTVLNNQAWVQKKDQKSHKSKKEPPQPWSLVSPEYVGSLVLKHLLSIASYHLGHSMVRNAVVAVPAKFNTEQRRATAAAYKAAGLKVVRVIEEPTAAAVAYRLHKRSNIHHILVYDFGGGTLDVSLLFVSKGSVQVLTTDGDDALGGSDFDLCLHDLLVDRLRRDYAFSPPSSTLAEAAGAGQEGSKAKGKGKAKGGEGQHDNLCSHSALQQKAEQLKKDLSYHDESIVTCSLFSLPSSPGGDVLVLEKADITVKTTEFLSTCKALFDRGLEPVERLLHDTGMTPDHVDEVVLVGGTTRIPFVKKQLVDFFGKPLNDHIDPDVTVAVGAASILD